jgi:hypothetical protein
MDKRTLKLLHLMKNSPIICHYRCEKEKKDLTTIAKRREEPVGGKNGRGLIFRCFLII